MAVVQANITPDNITMEQDQLLAAGSKISFRDLYNQEIDIPLHRGKFYKAEDVDNVFVLINGVLTDVSEHAHRSSKALELSRGETATAEANVERLSLENKQLKAQNEALELHLNNLIGKVTTADAPSSDVDIQALMDLNESISKDALMLVDENDSLIKDLDSTRSQLNDVTNQLVELQEAYSRLLETSVEKTNDSAIVKELQNELEVAKSANVNLSSENNRLYSLTDETKQRISEMNYEILELQDNIKSKDSTIKRLNARIESLRTLNSKI